MKMIPGSHKQGMLPHIIIPSEGNVLNEAIRPEFIDESRVVTVELQAGECSFHDIFMPHGSEPNRSSNRRCAFIVRYIPTYARLDRSVRKLFGPDYPLYHVRGNPGANSYANYP